MLPSLWMIIADLLPVLLAAYTVSRVSGSYTRQLTLPPLFGYDPVLYCMYRMIREVLSRIRKELSRTPHDLHASLLVFR